MGFETVIKFWFDEIEPKQWWIKDQVLDQLIYDRFLALHQQAVRGELFSWRQSAAGRLAEVIVLDQFSRNIYRDRPEAFWADPIALVLAQEAVDKKLDLQLPELQRQFFYLPFMHSESRLIHQQAEQLYRQLGNADNLAYELKHKAIIENFGRYPHRNNVLQRTSTVEEIEFLKQPGSSF